tara:strand:- start:59 stop:379 length:321 start_codon:yes stop_codon:yes gene_type:complete
MINDLGVDPDEWFETRYTNPLDTMPIATYVENDGSTGPLIPPPERKNFPSELMEVPTSIKNPKPKTKVEETPHHIAYEIATAKYNPFSVGGSENIHDFQGGSENVI